MFSYFLSGLFFISGVFFMLTSLNLMEYTTLVLEILTPMNIYFEGGLVMCFDFISTFFFSTVSFITSVVFIYSKYYMDIGQKENTDQKRFLLILFLFVMSMFFLVFSYSWFMVMLGWDGLGLVSFLLVIYYNNSKSLDSGMVTVLTNRVGDCFFLLSFMFMFYLGLFSFDYLSLTDCLSFLLIVMLGCITKSAQMPFSSWLPAAMAAPTPVSSLVHSSTLVTAGVYLLLRFNYTLSPTFPILAVISLLTMTMAGLYANYEMDFKKVVAMSTLSQLGFMIFTISMGNFLLAFLHMMFHAFFKSVLFLSTGNLMHFIFSNQDSRSFSTFFMSFYSKVFFTMSCLSLMGFPFSLGFYSKDTIIATFLFEHFSVSSFLFCVSCCFTVAYSIRLMRLGFTKFSYYDTFISFSESKLFFLPIIFLFMMNIFIGDFFLMWLINPNLAFSFLDVSLGLLIIFSGFMVNKYMKTNYNISSILTSMGLLPNLISKMSYATINMMTFKTDNTWNEVLAAQGVNNTLNFFKNNTNFLHPMKFTMWGALFVLMYLVLL